MKTRLTLTALLFCPYRFSLSFYRIVTWMWPRLVECTCSDVCTLTLWNPFISTIAHDQAHHFTYCTDWSLFDVQRGKKTHTTKNQLTRIMHSDFCAQYTHNWKIKRELSVKSTMTGKSHIKSRAHTHTHIHHNKKM